jgi:hypothetical protein
MKLEEIVLSEFKSTSKKRDFSSDGYTLVYYDSVGSTPYAIFFVYSKCGKSCVVKGMLEEVKKYCKQHFPQALINYTLWKNKRHRGGWRVNGKDIYVGNYVGKDNKRRGYSVAIYKNRELVKSLHFRRMPKKWIPEFDF